jgi:hypothetical protein
MPTNILRPNGTAQNTGTTNNSTSAHAATSDNSDTTWVTMPAGSRVWLDLGTFTIPAGNVVKSATIRVRGSGSSGSSLSAAMGPAVGELYAPSGTLSVTTTSLQTSTGFPLLIALNQTDINNLKVYLEANSAQRLAHEVYVDVVHADPPDLAGVGPTGTITTTRRPTISWSHSPGADGGAQTRRWVKIFTPAQYSAGGFNPETSPSFIDTGIVVSSASTWTVSSNLANGSTYRAYVKTYQTTNGVLQGSNWAFSEFNIQIPVPVPTAVTPASGGTVSSSRPPVGASVDGMTDGVLVTRRWELSTASNFLTDLRTIDDPNLALSKTGTFEYPAAVDRLPQGTWHIRCRTVDEYGVTSAWTTGHSFTVAHAPTTTNRTPSLGVSRQYATTVTLGWAFSDPDPQDFQTRWEVELWKASAPGSPLTASADNANQQGTVSGLNTTWRDTELRWRVRVRDQDNVWSAWSSEQVFVLRDLPTVTITSPTSGGTVTSAGPNITWSFSASAGRTQAKWRGRIRQQGLVTPGVFTQIADSGWVNGSATVWSAPDVLTVGPTFQVQVDLEDNEQLIGTSTHNFTANYDLPDPITFNIIDDDFATNGNVVLDWTAFGLDANFVEWRVYRRYGGSDWVLLGSGEASTKFFTDWTSPAQIDVEYAVTQVAVRLGDDVESSRVPTLFNGFSPKYLLVCPERPELNMVLHHVTADSFDNEQEMATINLLGRGRRVEYGTRFGVRGQINAELRDRPGETGRQQRLNVEAIRDAQVDVYLRNPFGDVYRVGLSAMQIDRTAGVGTQEYVTLSLEYIEVSGL